MTSAKTPFLHKIIKLQCVLFCETKSNLEQNAMRNLKGSIFQPEKQKSECISWWRYRYTLPEQDLTPHDTPTRATTLLIASCHFSVTHQMARALFDVCTFPGPPVCPSAATRIYVMWRSPSGKALVYKNSTNHFVCIFWMLLFSCNNSKTSCWTSYEVVKHYFYWLFYIFCSTRLA